MAPHSSRLAWKIPWTMEAGRLQSMRSLRVGHDWTTSLSLFTFMHWRRKWQPIQCSCLENPRDGGSWWAAIYGVAQSWTRLKWLSSRAAVTQSCPTPGNPMDCSRPGSPVHHQLPELAQTHVHQVKDAIQPSHPLSSPSPPAFNLSQCRVKAIYNNWHK